jgi:hypothetical protein
LNTEKKKTDEQNDITAEAVADLPVAKSNEESITGGALTDNQHGTHVAGTIGATGNNSRG